MIGTALRTIKRLNEKLTLFCFPQLDHDTNCRLSRQPVYLA